MADLRTFVLAARKQLIRETEEQLIQLYGLRPTGEFLPEKEVPALTRGEESKDAQDIRRKLRQLLRDEQEAGIAPSDALKKLTKEVAFTHLNRLVALKLLEGRKLMRGAVNNWHNSNAFLFYLSEHEDEQKLFEQGSQPIDDRGEGPSDRAYRHFLLWGFSKLAEEVKVLFDPANLASRLFPRPLVLRALVNELNCEDLKNYWAPGNEETIGWVYQFFNAEEKSAAFDRVFKKKQKFQKEDIPAATQIFTPRWIVEYLVQNSLGRLWVTMHPNSGLPGQMSYLVPMAAEPPSAPLKAAKEIRLLDPATGTMHFGLVAFDWLVKMYREELTNAGQPGWPKEPSVNSDEDIPGSILANNLFGIDIDLRAVQLSGLTLYLRAKQTNSNAKLTESRLACADIAIFRGQHLHNIAEELQFPDTVTRRLFAGFCESVDEAAQMGSLVRLEQHFQSMKAEQLRTAIDDYVARKAAQGEDESYFGNETGKGLRLLDIMTRRYDIVFTNPPYMSNRNMNPAMLGFMKGNYKKSKGDLYAAFIERCFEMLNDGGRMAMLTQQSFMSISSFEGLRELLLRNTAIENMAHTGTRTFAEVSGEKVNTTAYVLRRDATGELGQKAVGTYFRLVKESDAQRKLAAFEEANGKLRRGQTDFRIYHYSQSDFFVIPGSPWVYWITPTLRSVFKKFPKLEAVAPPMAGLQTGINERYIRHWWECGLKNIERNHGNSLSGAGKDFRWFPCMKGGGLRRWYGNQESCVNWFRDGAEIRACTPSSVIRNPDFYFRPGVTFPLLSSKGINARLVPSGFIYDISSPFLITERADSVCAFLNSSLASYLLAVLNPTLNFPPGDVGRLPFNPATSSRISGFVKNAVRLVSEEATENENTYMFVAPPEWASGCIKVAQRDQDLAALEQTIDEEIYQFYGISAVDRSVIDDELSVIQEAIDPEPSEESGPEEASDRIEAVDALSQDNLSRRWVSYAIGVALGRFCPGVDRALGRGAFPAEISQRLRELSAQDGMMVLERGHPDDLAQRVLDILSVAQGDEEAERIVRLATGETGEVRDSLGNYLLAPFFKDHVRQYRKRPVYWLFQSPKRTFSVYLFHEMASINTLSALQGNRFVGGRLHWLETELADLLLRAARAEGREKSSVTKRAREIAEALEDLKAFDASLSAANQFPIKDANGLPATVRWEPELDDGVLLNAAPLHDLAPAWKMAGADLKNAWNELEDSKYEWTKTAMRYWPGRVLKACKTNESFRIAHGL